MTLKGIKMTNFQISEAIFSCDLLKLNIDYLNNLLKCVPSDDDIRAV